jgi:Zn-dependent protease
LTTLLGRISFCRSVTQFLLILPILLLSVVAHEYAHAWTAYQQGDDTAHKLGRLTFNPLPHIDPFASVLLPALLWFATSASGHPFTFGAARPVPINPANFRHLRRGDLIVSSAGIVMNLLLALTCGACFIAIGLAGRAFPDADVFTTLQYLAEVGISLNILLAFFNLVPLPPLDGSHLFYHLLPAAWGEHYRRLGRYGFVVLLLTMWFLPGVWNAILTPVDRMTGAALSALQPWALAGPK